MKVKDIKELIIDMSDDADITINGTTFWERFKREFEKGAMLSVGFMSGVISILFFLSFIGVVSITSY